MEKSGQKVRDQRTIEVTSNAKSERKADAKLIY